MKQILLRIWIGVGFMFIAGVLLVHPLARAGEGALVLGVEAMSRMALDYLQQNSG